MGWDAATRKLTRPISIDDLGAALSSSSKSSTELARHANVNKWGRYVSVTHSTGEDITEAQRLAAKFGLEWPTSYGAYSTLFAAVRSNPDLWTRPTPTGPARRLDFDGYYADAKAPFNIRGVTQAGSAGAYVNLINIDINQNTAKGVTGLDIYNMLGSGFSLIAMIMLASKSPAESSILVQTVAAFDATNAAKSALVHTFALPANAAYYVGRELDCALAFYRSSPATPLIPAPDAYYKWRLTNSDYAAPVTFTVKFQVLRTAACDFNVFMNDASYSLDANAISATFSGGTAGVTSYAYYTGTFTTASRKVRVGVVKIAMASGTTSQSVRFVSYNGTTLFTGEITSTVPSVEFELDLDKYMDTPTSLILNVYVGR